MAREINLHLNVEERLAVSEAIHEAIRQWHARGDHTELLKCLAKVSNRLSGDKK